MPLKSEMVVKMVVNSLKRYKKNILTDSEDALFIRD
jgi:hypothetical protein